MFLPLVVDLALRTLFAESGMGWTVASNSIVATVLSSVYSFVQFLSRYMTPASDSALEQVLSVQYSVVTPLLKHLIYSSEEPGGEGSSGRLLGRNPRLTF